MTDEEYIRSRRYGLLYIYNKGGVLVKHASSIFTDDNNHSVVLAARGSYINFQENFYKEPTIELENPVSGNGGYLNKQLDSMNLYSWMCSSSVGQVKNLLRKNPNQSEWIKDRFKVINSESCKCLIVLLDLTNVKSDNVDDVNYITFIKLKIGGAELISEFLLSQFINEWEEEFEFDDLKPIEQEYDFEKFIQTLSSETVVEGECSPIFKLETYTNLNHLTQYRLVEHCDEFERWFVENGSHFYFNVDIKNKKKLDAEYLIPRRVYEILEPHQIELLEKTAPSVIDENLVFVYKTLLRQKTPPSKSRQMSVPRDTWGSEMYSILGGDGCGDVYLGDGMSLDSNGRLVDD